MRRLLVVLLLVVLVGCLGLPLVSAHTTQIGLTGYGGYSTASYANQMIIAKFSTASLTPGLQYKVINGSFYGGTGWTKLVVMDIDRHILGVSNAVNAVTKSTLYNVTFSDEFYVNSLSGWVGLGVVYAGGGEYVYYSGGGNTIDTSNSYDSPSDPTDVSYSGSIVSMVITVTTDYEGAPTPTPSPSPVPTVTMPPYYPSPTFPWVSSSPTLSPTVNNTNDFGSSFYWVFLVLGSVVAFMFGLFALLGDKGNKAVNVLIAVVSLVVFVVVLFAIGVL